MPALFNASSIQACENKVDFVTLIYHFPRDFAQGLNVGASVAHNGVCLTVTRIVDQSLLLRYASMSLIKPWPDQLGALQAGDEVNLARRK